MHILMWQESISHIYCYFITLQLYKKITWVIIRKEIIGRDLWSWYPISSRWLIKKNYRSHRSTAMDVIMRFYSMQYVNNETKYNKIIFFIHVISNFAILGDSLLLTGWEIFKFNSFVLFLQIWYGPVRRWCHIYQ